MCNRLWYGRSQFFALWCPWFMGTERVFGLAGEGVMATMVHRQAHQEPSVSAWKFQSLQSWMKLPI